MNNKVYTLPVNTVRENDVPLQKIFYLNKYWKEMADMYNTPYFDCVCDSEKREYPTRYNWIDEVLEYYNGQTEMWTPIPGFFTTQLQVNSVDNLDQNTLNLVDSASVTVSYDGNGKVSFHASGGGTVTSIDIDGDGALDVTGGPITTSGLLQLDWLGTNSEYVLGDGSLATLITDNNQLSNGAGYLTTETDPTVPAHVKSITAQDILDWGTAFSWGDHSTMGYLTSISAAGNNTELQYNNSGVLGASSNLKWIDTDGRLVIGNPSLTNALSPEKLVIDGDIRLFQGGVNFSPNNNASFCGIKSGPTASGFSFYGASNLIARWFNTYATTGRVAGEMVYNLSPSTNTDPFVEFRIRGNVQPTGNNNTDLIQLLIDPIYNQTGSNPAWKGTGDIRGIYYTPTLTDLHTSPHIAYENTSGDIIHGNLAGVGTRIVTAESDGKLAVKDDPFEEFPEAVYGETVTFTTLTGGTAPSGTLNHRITGQKMFKRMSVDIRLLYTSNGTGVTSVSIPIPASYPQPKLLSGMTMTANEISYPANITLVRTDSGAPLSVSRAYITVNAAGTGFEIKGDFGGSTITQIHANAVYPIS